MIPDLAPPLLGALAIFLAAGALTGQFEAGRRRMVQRALEMESRRLQHEAAEAGDEVRAQLLREDAVASSPLLSAMLRHFSWSERRAATLVAAALPLKVSEYASILLISFIAVSVGGWLVSGFAPAGLGAGVLAVLVIELWVRRRAGGRSKRFNEQLPAALQMMSIALQSGFGIMEAIRTVSREMETPLSDEFRRLLDEVAAGGSLEESLERMASRFASPDMRLVMQALAIHRNVGGNLGEILEQVAETMRERDELRRHIQSLTSQERASSLIVAALPVFVVGMFQFMAPELIAPLWEETTGRIILGVAIGFEVVGFMLMRRVMTIEV